MIRFIAEVFQALDWPPELALGAAVTTDSQGNKISEFYCERPTAETYWTDWGGTYDNPNSSNLQLLFNEYLQKVGDVTTLLATVGSFFVDGGHVYTNTEYYPWQYARSDTEADISEGYSTSPVDPAFPSNHFIEDDSGAEQLFPVRMEIPQVSNKLSDPISGTALYSTFSITLHNNDGRFDKTENTNYFNAPLFVYKSIIEKPNKTDFNVIRKGLVDDMKSSKTAFTIKSNDIFTSLDEYVCSVITLDDFPSAPDDSIDKNMPVAYGEHNGVKLIEVGTNEYIATDPAYLVSVSAVYDGSGSSITFSVASGVITATGAETADIVALTDNTIGEAITNEISEKSNIAYTSDSWDTVETDSYISLSGKLNIWVEDGDVKTFVKKCLKSDNAFLISKNNGLLTIRRWEQIYQTHVIEPWTITQFPTKTFVDSKYYNSSVIIKYDFNNSTGEYGGTLLDDSDEATISERYRKKQRKTYETLLTSETEAQNLATRLLTRFGQRAEKWKIALGVDTSEINLLDTIDLNLTINGRELSDIKSWIVTQVDASQDTVVVESSTDPYYNKTDGILSESTGETYDGYLAGDKLASISAFTEES